MPYHDIIGYHVMSYHTISYHIRSYVIIYEYDIMVGLTCGKGYSG